MLATLWSQMSLLILCALSFTDGGIVAIDAVVHIIGLAERLVRVDDVTQQIDEVFFEKL